MYTILESMCQRRLTDEFCGLLACKRFVSQIVLAQEETQRKSENRVSTRRTLRRECSQTALPNCIGCDHLMITSGCRKDGMYNSRGKVVATAGKNMLWMYVNHDLKKGQSASLFVRNRTRDDSVVQKKSLAIALPVVTASATTGAAAVSS